MQLREFVPKAINRLYREARKIYCSIVIANAKKQLSCSTVTILSQNCIGGVFYHDMGMRFDSPTINLYFSAADFIKFASNPIHYAQQELHITWGEEYPIGCLDDVKIHFMHYTSCSDAKEKWERRVKRIHWDKIIVLCTDMEGFSPALFEEWKKISYPKLLFASRAYKDESVVCFEKYSGRECVPDLIPKREFYKKNILINKINAMK